MADDERLTGQVPFDEEEDTEAELSTEAIEEENFEPRCACLLLLDTSSSMSGSPIREVNRGIQGFRSALLQDELAALRVEPAIVTFDTEVRTVVEFGTADRFNPPELRTKGRTSMGAGILRAIAMIEERKRYYDEHALERWRPWLWLMTDGRPTDAWQEAARQVREGVQEKRFLFFAVGTATADFSVLREISALPPVRLKEAGFGKMFEWLSRSMRSVSRSASDVEKMDFGSVQSWGELDTR
jgi:uncharacterized protein YegL